MMRRPGWLLGLATVGCFVACAGGAHPLGGKERSQPLSGSGSTTGSGKMTDAVDSGAGGGGALADAAPPRSETAGDAMVGSDGSPTNQNGGVCPAVSVMGFLLFGCYLDDGTCGVDVTFASPYSTSLATDPPSELRHQITVGCQPYNAPGNIDPLCPQLFLPEVGPLQGCCRPDGTCGADMSSIFLGCVQERGVSNVQGGDAGRPPPPYSYDPCTYVSPTPTSTPPDGGR